MTVLVATGSKQDALVELLLKGKDVDEVYSIYEPFYKLIKDNSISTPLVMDRGVFHKLADSLVLWGHPWNILIPITGYVGIPFETEKELITFFKQVVRKHCDPNFMVNYFLNKNKNIVNNNGKETCLITDLDSYDDVAFLRDRISNVYTFGMGKTVDKIWHDVALKKGTKEEIKETFNFVNELATKSKK